MRIVYILLGCLSLACGCAGVFLPVLPTVPFFALAAFCFAKGSARLSCWFKGTGLYKKYLEDFVQKKALTLRRKVLVICVLTLSLAAAFILMRSTVARIIISVVWAAHVFMIVLIKTDLKK